MEEFDAADDEEIDVGESEDDDMTAATAAAAATAEQPLVELLTSGVAGTA